MKNKKLLIIIGILVLLGIIAILFFMLKPKDELSTTENSEKPAVFEQSEPVTYASVDYQITAVKFGANNETVDVVIKITNYQKEEVEYNLADWALYDVSNKKDIKAESSNDSKGVIQPKESIERNLSFKLSGGSSYNLRYYSPLLNSNEYAFEIKVK